MTYSALADMQGRRLTPMSELQIPPCQLASSQDSPTRCVLLAKRADELMGCIEGSSKEAELAALTYLIEAYEAQRGPAGKICGGKRQPSGGRSLNKKREMVARFRANARLSGGAISELVR